MIGFSSLSLTQNCTVIYVFIFYIATIHAVNVTPDSEIYLVKEIQVYWAESDCERLLSKFN